MKTNIKKNLAEVNKKIKRFKVKLDYKTIITIKDIAALDTWKTRYPKAKIVGEIYV